MKNHALILLIALVVSACASSPKEDVSSLDQQRRQAEQYGFLEGHASRIR